MRQRAEKPPMLISLPREVSAAAMMLVSGIGGLVLAKLSLLELLVGLVILSIHFLTFEPSFYYLRGGRLCLFILLASLNTAPYLLLAVVKGITSSQAVLLAVGLVMLFIHVFVERRAGAGTEAEYIYGSTILVLPALSLPTILGRMSISVFVYWLLLTIYVAATAAYVESLLPWRRVRSWVAVLVLAPSWLLVLISSYTVLALIEPTITYTLAAIRPRKISPRNLKKLGRRTLARLLLFAFLSWLAARGAS